jgi:hypothetical protein
MNKQRRSVLCFGLFAALVLMMAEQASAVQTRVEVIYTNGAILEGPLSFGLTILPISVRATMLLEGPVTTPEFGPQDVISMSLNFGDAHFTQSDLHPLSIEPGIVSELGVIATFATLSYRLGGGDPVLADYGPLEAIYPGASADPCASPTATVRCRLASNSDFELNLFGQDIASGQFLHYRYTTSEQFGIQVPEPTAAALALLALLGLTCRHNRGRHQC